MTLNPVTEKLKKPGKFNFLSPKDSQRSWLGVLGGKSIKVPGQGSCDRQGRKRCVTKVNTGGGRRAGLRRGKGLVFLLLPGHTPSVKWEY